MHGEDSVKIARINVYAASAGLLHWVNLCKQWSVKESAILNQVEEALTIAFYSTFLSQEFVEH
jgi:hypothetical protein